MTARRRIGRRPTRIAALVIVVVGALTTVAVPARASDPTTVFWAIKGPVLAGDLAYDATRDLLYASVPATSPTYANHVVALDPSSGAVRKAVRVGDDPGALALSDDASALYVGFKGESSLARLSPASFTVVKRTPLELSDQGVQPAVFVADLEVQRGNADVVVASLTNTVSTPSHEAVVAVDAAGMRPVIQRDEGANRLARGPDGQTFYGYDDETSAGRFSVFSLRADGVHVVPAQTYDVLTSWADAIEYYDGRLYTSNGQVVDVGTLATLGEYSSNGGIEPVAAINRTYVFYGELITFDLTTFRPLGRMSVPAVHHDRDGVLVATGSGLAGTDSGGNLFLFTPPATSRFFTDVAGMTHTPGIAATADAGVSTGYANGTFRPENTVTRGQMATFLMRALDLPRGTVSFPDAVGHTHAAGISAIATVGITQGYADGSFRPDEPVSREQMATFLTRGFELPAETRQTPFSDVAGTHARSVASLYYAGITGGTGGSKFSPARSVTRGQMATFLARGLELTDRLVVAAARSSSD